MALRAGTHTIGPAAGTIQIRTYREGMAQRVGHDLVIDVAEWEATIVVAAGGAPTAIALEADPHSLQIREGLHGLKPLSDRDRAEIRKTIDAKVLGGRPIVYRSSAVEVKESGLAVSGELTLAGQTRKASFEVELDADGRVHGTLRLEQSQWGIKPYRGLMGALKVRDDVDVVVDAPLPTA